jgi:hypothetical protein
VDGQIAAIYSLCDDVLKTLPHAEDPPRCAAPPISARNLKARARDWPCSEASLPGLAGKLLLLRRFALARRGSNTCAAISPVPPLPMISQIQGRRCKTGSRATLGADISASADHYSCAIDPPFCCANIIAKPVAVASWHNPTPSRLVPPPQAEEGPEHAPIPARGPRMLDSSRAQHYSPSWRKRAFKIPVLRAFA